MVDIYIYIYIWVTCCIYIHLRILSEKGESDETRMVGEGDPLRIVKETKF